MALLVLRGVLVTAAALKALDRGLAELGLGVSADQVERLHRLAQRVASWGGRINLTGHRGALEVARRLVLDAAALLAAGPSYASLADLGAGAGFPGLPIAILRPDVRVTLVEARQRRHHFQRAMRRELALDNVSPVWGRAEAVDATAHAAVVAQALGPADRALAWMLPWAEVDGWLLIPGGEKPPSPAATASVHGVEVREYQVPESGPRRTLWLARRAS